MPSRHSTCVCEDALGPNPETFPGPWLSRWPRVLATGIILRALPCATASLPASPAATSWSLSLPDLFPAQRPETPQFPWLSTNSYPSSPHADCITSHPDPWLFHPASPVLPPQSQLFQRTLPHALPHSPLCQNLLSGSVSGPDMPQGAVVPLSLQGLPLAPLLSWFSCFFSSCCFSGSLWPPL